MNLNEQYSKYVKSREKYLNLKKIKAMGGGDSITLSVEPPSTLSKLSHKEGEKPEHMSTNIIGSDPLVITGNSSTQYNERNILWRGNLNKNHSLAQYTISWIALSQKVALIYGYPLKLRVAKKFKILNMQVVNVRNAVRKLLEKSNIKTELDAFDIAFPIETFSVDMVLDDIVSAETDLVEKEIVRRMSMFDVDSKFIEGLYREWPTDWLDQGYLGIGTGRIFLSKDDTGGHHSEMALFFKDSHPSDDYFTSLGIEDDVVTPEQEEKFIEKRISNEEKKTREDGREEGREEARKLRFLSHNEENSKINTKLF
jgi:hypothetical protein